MADVLAKQTGQTFVVDNKPGATQMIGARLAANAKPDGATIFFGSVTSLAINPSVKKELPYDPVRDFEPIALTFVSPQYLITRRGLAPNSMRELVDLAKTRAGQAQLCLDRTRLVGASRRGAAQDCRRHRHDACAL